MTQFSYLRIPIDADQGFPQAVRISFGRRSYVVSSRVNVTEESLLLGHDPLRLPQRGAFLVVEVSAEEATGSRMLFRRKVVPNLEYQAEELALLFTDLRVHPLNLNSAGAHGSSVVGGIASRWDS
ncbi:MULTISPECIES: hypothetical protein [unclassified Nocardia]|uniref:hypothetical protein n=1 Tax=unclassified Nocardia TaxID=2637762 RepID=UPI001CE499CB|nr:MULTISPECIES: hypothetical protein [unclassified Nocardia]